MADNTIQRAADLVRSVIELLWYKPAGLPAKDVLQLIPEITPLSEYEAGYTSSNNVPRYETIIRLATIPLVKAGWMIKSDKGRWVLTEDGRQACRKFTNAQELYKEAMRIFEEEKQGIPEIMITVESSEEKAWDQIEKYLLGRKPFELRTMLAYLLRASGYHVAWIAPQDEQSYNIDLITWMDPIGAKKPRIVVQISQTDQALTDEEVRLFTSMLKQDDFGLLFSPRGATHEAKEELNSLPSQNMSIMDLESFFDLWVMQYNKLSWEAQRMLPLKLIHFLSFSE